MTNKKSKDKLLSSILDVFEGSIPEYLEDGLRQRLERIDNLESDAELLRKKNKALSSDVGGLKLKIERLEKRYNEAVEERDSLRSQVEQHKNDMDNIKKREYTVKHKEDLALALERYADSRVSDMKEITLAVFGNPKFKYEKTRGTVTRENCEVCNDRGWRYYNNDHLEVEDGRFESETREESS